MNLDEKSMSAHDPTTGGTAGNIGPPSNCVRFTCQQNEQDENAANVICARHRGAGAMKVP